MTEAIVKELISFVTSNSYFDYESFENNHISFATRKNGSVANERASNIDLIEARQIRKKILDNFKISVKIEVVDEWVIIFITDIVVKETIYSYVFIKDFNGCGFQKSFETMDKLIDSCKGYVQVDWDKVKNDIGLINSFPKSTFIGWKESNRHLIKRADDADNIYGYNFYITKRIKDE